MQIDPNTGKVKLEGWPKGVNNRAPDHGVPDDTLRDAVNVEVLSDGKIRTREGITARISSLNAHSVFANSEYMVWGTDDAVWVSTDGIVATRVFTDVRLNTPLSMVDVNGTIYWSNEYLNGKINSLGSYEPWGIAVPSGNLTLLGSNVDAGALPRQYQVVCTFVTASGEESGAGLASTVLCGDVPLISVYNIPQSPDSRVVATRIYVTNIDGSIFYRNQDVPAGTTSTTLSGFFANGTALKTQFNGPPPPGQLLEYHKGKIYIASGNVLWHTEPLTYNMIDNVSGFYMYPERITLAKAVTDGIYVSSERTWFIGETQQTRNDQAQAETTKVQQQIVFNHRAVEGAACNLPNTKDVMWVSERGFVRGSDSGKADLLTESQLAMNKYARGSLAYTNMKGHQAVTAMLSGGVLSGEVNPDYTAGEAKRLSELA